MARLRTVKPSFFTNEELVTVDPLGRLLFIGLWCEADREGRLEDRPARLKIQLLPTDNADVVDLLDQLERAGLIARYQVDGARYLHIINFLKHQRPHFKEAPSEIPPPPTPTKASAVTSLDECPPSIKEGGSTNLGECEHQPRTVQAPTKVVDSTPRLPSLDNGIQLLDPTGSRDSAEPRPAKPKPKSLAPIFDAFRGRGIRDPVIVGTSGEGKAAQGLLGRYTADQIADCWRFVSEHGSEWERGHVSFGYLARNQVVEHWVNGELKESTRASPNGKPALSAAAQRFVGVERTFDAEGEIAGQEAGP